MSLLDELSKRDKDWRRLALKICGCPETAHDLVQEMYLKIYNQENIRPFENRSHESVYVYRTLKSIWIDQNRTKHEYTTNDPDVFTNLEKYVKDDDILEFRKHINTVLNQMDLVDREVLLWTHQYSLRETAEILNELPFGKVSYFWVYQRKKEAMKIFKELLNEYGIDEL